MKRIINLKKAFQCDHELQMQLIRRKLIILSFNQGTKIDIQERIMLWGKIWKYKAHIEEDISLKQECQVYFKDGKTMIFQNEKNILTRARFGIHSNVKLIALVIDSNSNEDLFPDSSEFIFNKEVLLKMHKQYLNVLNPTAYEEKQKLIKEKDVMRNHTLKRKISKRRTEEEPKTKLTRKLYEQTPQRKLAKKLW